MRVYLCVAKANLLYFIKDISFHINFQLSKQYA